MRLHVEATAVKKKALDSPNKITFWFVIYYCQIHDVEWIRQIVPYALALRSTEKMRGVLYIFP